MSLFKIFEEKRPSDELNKIHQGSLFHSIEYEIGGIVNKINNIDNLDDQEINNIITRQHHMILNYDLFLMSPETRAQAQILFTSKKFLKCFLGVIRILDISQHEKICLNKLAFDYYILPEKNMEVSDLLYQLTTEVNTKEVVSLSSILGRRDAQILAMIRNSSFKEEKCVHRVNTFLIKSYWNISVKELINIYCFLFGDRFSTLFIYTMMENKPEGLSSGEEQTFNYISIAMADILSILPMKDIKKVLADYYYTLKMVRSNIVVRYSLKTIKDRPRIDAAITELKVIDNIDIP